MDQKKRYYYDLWKDAYSEVGRAEICHAKGITFPIPLGEYDYNHIKQIGGQGHCLRPGLSVPIFFAALKPHAKKRISTSIPNARW